MAKTISRRSVELNLEIEKGSDFRTTINWSTKDANGDIQPVNLSLCHAMMQIREALESEEVLFELSSEDGGGESAGRIILKDEGAQGNMIFHIAASLSDDWEWERAVYSLEIKFPTGDIRRLLRGKVRAYDEITRNDWTQF